MKALIVYESMFGNTRAIAEAVAEGARSGMEVVVRPVSAVTAADVAEAQLVVAGAPTHLHGLPRRGTRRSAAKMAAAGHGLTLEPGADGPGMREWLRTLPRIDDKRAAVFDTRIPGSAYFTGRASLRIGRKMREAGFQPAVPPASFLVDRSNRLRAGETERAQAWGKGLAARFGGADDGSASG